MTDVKFYADCIRKGDDPEAVLQVALAEQRDRDALVAERMYPLGSQVQGGTMPEGIPVGFKVGFVAPDGFVGFEPGVYSNEDDARVEIARHPERRDWRVFGIWPLDPERGSVRPDE